MLFRLLTNIYCIIVPEFVFIIYKAQEESRRSYV